MFKQTAELLRSGKMILYFLTAVLPSVNRELSRWEIFAQTRMHGQLQQQALASLAHKRFHCQGGSFYSIYPCVATREFIPFIVALQTISDYLDNLCDRADVFDETAFRTLHFAMADAITPAAPRRDYYADYPFKDDGGYLDCLVDTCQRFLEGLPAYPLVKAELLRQAALYSELQTYKHIDCSRREHAMLDWLERVNTTTELTHWEFAAATGSTLGLFMLAAAAGRANLTAVEVQTIAAAYFPWICGLHIQLDYLIDQAEDQLNHDLNFIFYYKDNNETAARLKLFCQRALGQAGKTPHPFFAKTIVRGLIALYLSDPKMDPPAAQTVRDELLQATGAAVNCLYLLCRVLRRKKIL